MGFFISMKLLLTSIFQRKNRILIPWKTMNKLHKVFSLSSWLAAYSSKWTSE